MNALKTLKNRWCQMNTRQQILFVLWVIALVVTDFIFLLENPLYAVISLGLTILTGVLFYKAF